MEKNFLSIIISFSKMAIVIFLTLSCTHITYESNGYIPIYLTTRADHEYAVEITKVREFYLWGNIGPDKNIALDEIFFDQGYLSISKLEVNQFQSFSQFMSALFSLGFYIPISYSLKARGARAGD